MKRSKYVSQNGEVVPFDEGKVHIFSPAVKYGATVYEVIKGYWNHQDEQLYLFRAQKHLERLEGSVRLARFDSPYGSRTLLSWLMALIEANDFREDVDSRLMLYIDGDGGVAATGPVGVGIVSLPKINLFDTEGSLRCCVSSWRRIEDDSMPPRIKAAANYHNGRLALIQAKLDGYDGVILLDRAGKVTEGPTSCLFIARGGKVITPPLTGGILESITRETLIELFKEAHGVEVQEREVDRTELYLADEAFFCGTGAEITPIVSIDRHELGDGKPGPLTGAIRETYLSITRGLTPAHSEWRTPVYAKKAAS